MRDNVYTKEKKPLNDREEDLKSLEEEYNHIRVDSRITWGKQEEVCYVVILSHKIPVLIYIISGEVLFNQNCRCTCYTTADQICVSSQLPVRQELLPLQLVNYFFHCRWLTTSSIAGCQLYLLLQVVNNVFRCRWSTTSYIVAGQLLLPLLLFKYFFHYRGSRTSSVTGGQRLLPLHLVNYIFHCN